jgi:acylglycerol lipase
MEPMEPIMDPSPPGRWTRDRRPGYSARVRPLALALLLFAPACAAKPVPATAPPEVAGVEHREHHFAGHGGVDLYAQSWRPTTPRGVVVIVHGLKDHSARYAGLARALVDQGLAVHALDLRGHGRSAGERALTADFADYTADLEIFLAQVKAAEPGLPVVLFGHSMGGAIATTYALAHPQALHGLVLSAAALQLDASVGPGLVKITRKLGRKHPGWHVLKLKPKHFSRDPAVVAEVRGGDPLVDPRKVPAGTAAALINAIEHIQADMEKLAVPVLILHGDADRITPPDGSRSLYRRAGIADKQLEIYPGDYHDLLHEPNHDAVAGDITAWVLRHLNPPASEAAPAAAPATEGM